MAKLVPALTIFLEQLLTMLPILRWPGLLGWLAVVAAGAPAEAHFLFIRVTPPAEGGRAVEVYFSERATAGDPRFVAKIAATQLWAQAAPGELKPLVVRASSDRLRAHLAQAGSLGVVGYLQYGVLARPGQTPFLLRYYSKAIAGRADELNRLKPRESAGMEIVATVGDNAMVLTALADGRPVPRAVFHTIDKLLVNEERTAVRPGRRPRQAITRCTSSARFGKRANWTASVTTKSASSPRSISIGPWCRAGPTKKRSGCSKWRSPRVRPGPAFPVFMRRSAVASTGANSKAR